MSIEPPILLDCSSVRELKITLTGHLWKGTWKTKFPVTPCQVPWQREGGTEEGRGGGEGELW